MLITRKVPYVTRLLFKHLGVLAFETHHQYFHPDVEAAMSLVRHTDGLGFHDIVFSLAASPTLVRFLDGRSPSLIDQYRATFLSHENDILAFAVERSIGFWQFLAQIGLPWTTLEQEEYDYDEVDHWP